MKDGKGVIKGSNHVLVTGVNLRAAAILRFKT